MDCPDDCLIRYPTVKLQFCIMFEQVSLSFLNCFVFEISGSLPACVDIQPKTQAGQLLLLQYKNTQNKTVMENVHPF